MKKIIDRIVESPGEPGKNDLWIKTNIDGSSELKHFSNGRWKGIAGGSGGGSEGYVKYADLVPEFDIDFSDPEYTYPAVVSNENVDVKCWRIEYDLMKSYAAVAIRVRDTSTGKIYFLNHNEADESGFSYHDNGNVSAKYITLQTGPGTTFNGWEISVTPSVSIEVPTS